uniref:Inner centromere protein n=1 Tax=Calidris pygmaea TaxID=425635 RepID=A0A8C3PIH9_9CHAR
MAAMMAEGPARLPALCRKRLAEFLQRVDDTDLLWLREIGEEAARMFGSQYSDEPELMPKTPSQKNRQRRKRFSVLQEESQALGRKRLSRRRNSSFKLVPSPRYSQRLRNKEKLEVIRAEIKQVSPPQRVTRSQAAAFHKISETLPETLPAQQVEGKVPSAEAGLSDRISAELHLQKSTPKPAEKISTTILLSPDDAFPEESRVAKSPPGPAASELLVPHSPEANDAGESEAAAKLPAANTTFILSEEESRLEEGGDSAQVQEGSEKEPSQHMRDNPGTPRGSRLSRRSVRRSLMGRTSMTRRTSLAEKYSLASKRESMIQKSIARTVKKKAARKSSVSSSCMDGNSGEVPEDEETVVKAGIVLGPSYNLTLRQSGGFAVYDGLYFSHRRQPSYKRAVDECYDNQQAEEGGLSPPKKKIPSPAFPASKVVRPFKTFLHTVQKNQLLMTPISAGRNGVIKSFIKYNTPLRSDSKEKERQKLETLRKKQEAEELRKQKLEEEKKRRLEEAKLKREERLRKVLQARERAEQIEEERKRRIEQKIALFDEKTEKVREERLAEEKIKKKAAAKKMEEAEARRRQEEEARKQKALQQEEEERRHKELMQKRKEEEQERARKIAEQRRAEQEREKKLAAERELERKKEQERIQAENLVRRINSFVVWACQQEEQGLAERKRQEQEEKEGGVKEELLLPEVQKAKDRARTQLLEKKENSPVCSSYQMTPHAQRKPKPPVINSNNYGLDLNSDDSTDDESQPRKPVPAWATGNQLSQAVIHQYYNPPNIDAVFGVILSPKLEDIFYKSKPRYVKRTSSAVWNSPPFPGAKSTLGLPYSIKKY